MKIACECIITQQADGRFLVTFPSFEEAFTEGNSVEESLLNAEEVLTLTLEGRMDEGMEIPMPTLGKLKKKNSHFIHPRKH